MGYSIRYDSGRIPEIRRDTGLRLRILTAMFLMLTVIGVSVLWPRGREILVRWILPAGTQVELATQAMAEAVAAGGGWYHGFAVFCAAILNGAA